MSPRQKNIISLVCIITVIAVLTSVWLWQADSASPAIPDVTFKSVSDIPRSDIEEEPKEQNKQNEQEQQKEEEKEVKQALKIKKVYPTGKLIGTKEREAYKGETMTLIIPKLDVNCVIQNGTDEQTLKKSPGLYEYAQMPSTNNSNVSIAGHRDIHGSHFYYLDTLKDGDKLYLIYDKQIYQYEYRTTKIYKPDDWEPIRCNNTSCLTLTTCDPIGTSLNRLVVSSELAAIFPFAEGFEYK